MLGVNKARPMIMHIDLNSCFATIEQQSRPLLRGRPVAIVNRRTEKTFVVAASYEAKKRGVGVGVRVETARLLCPTLVLVESDPPKYRYVYRRLMAILEDYSPFVRMKSIDEGLIDFTQSSPSLQDRDLLDVGLKVKQRIREEIGEHMMCNIGIGTNRFLAKTAAGFDKPDGLAQIDHTNLAQALGQLELEDLTGIASGYGRRLRRVGITTPLEFLAADESVLVRQVFHGKCGSDWHRRLRGWEVDDIDFGIKSIGRQFVMDERGLGHDEVLRRFHHLCEDVVAKMRQQGVAAKAAQIYVRSHNIGYWKSFRRQVRAFYDEAVLVGLVEEMLAQAPLPVYEIGVRCYDFVPSSSLQGDLFGEMERADNLSSAVDDINMLWGPRTVHAARTLGLDGQIKRKVPFGSTRFL